MTVDDRSFAAFSIANAEKASHYIVKVRDVTGISDDEKIKWALDRARQPEGGFNLNQAIHLLMSSSNGAAEGRLVTVREEEMPASPATPAIVMNPTASQPLRPVVDLTEDASKPTDDLQRAIELSLAEGGGTGSSAFSQEDQDVSKALEASLLESSRSRRKTDSHNPNDKKRDGEWPVGLKNVGQTCWFSAVIQSLFHLPAFRYLVLNFQPVQKPARSENQRVIDFMLELRKLFALLVGSQRSCVDPSQAVGILRGTMGGEGQFTNSQQDVSEFTHNLLDWLEEAFKITDKFESGRSKADLCDPNAMDSESEKCDMEKEAVEDKKIKEVTVVDRDKPASSGTISNPMKDLFYGLVKIEGRNQGNVFTKEEPFGQWPLQVNSFSDIHESLNASTAHENIDTSSQSDLVSAANGQSTAVRNSGQERWFTKLPPVLFFELCRFKFNQQRCVAEKVNNFLDFPETIYLDRYLEMNKNITRSKREEVKRLQEREEVLRSRLKAFQEYGSQPKLPLVSVLQHALEFTRSGHVVGESDSPSNCAMQVDSPCPSPASLTPSTSVTNLASLGKSSAEKTAAGGLKTLSDGSVIIPIRVECPETPMEVETEPPEGPAPRHLSELELKVMSGALTRWRKEVEEDIAALDKALQDIEQEISRMYEDPSLKQNPYTLHAVMVHEGDANQGHYWAYVFHTGRQVWLKFNDNTVSETTWEAMKKESTGGRMNTSAYSMVYIDASRPDLTRVAGTEVQDPGATREALPEDLETFLMEDNKLFAAEIINWDREQERKQKAAAEECQDGVLIGDDPECQIIEHKPNLSNSHSVLAQDLTRRALANVMPRMTFDKRKSGSAANILVAELSQMVEANLGDATTERVEEPRLQSFVHYLIGLKVRDDVLRRALLEQVANSGLQTVSEAARLVVQDAKDLLAAEVSPSVLEESKKWHRTYHNFRIACYYFLLGVERSLVLKLEEAVELLTVAYSLNQRLLEDPPLVTNPTLKAIPEDVLMKQFYGAVESLNLRYVEEFENGDNPAEISQVSQSVSRVLVPAIHILQARTNLLGTGRDARLLEEVRSRWCTMLEKQMPKAKHDYWTTIFNTVVSDESPATQRQPQNLRYPKLAEDRSLAQKFLQTLLTHQQK